MGSINIGFTDNRNSSRVLKPPGGDTSDIFGVRELKKVEEEKLKQKQIKVETKLNGDTKKDIEPEIKEQEKTCSENAQPETEKKDNLNGNSENKIEDKIEDDKKNSEEKENNEVNGNAEKVADSEKDKPKEVHEEKPPENIKDILTEKPQTNGTLKEEVKINGTDKRPKNRIPPGGYSSGLW